jgi:hypothetical protein
MENEAVRKRPSRKTRWGSATSKGLVRALGAKTVREGRGCPKAGRIIPFPGNQKGRP